MAKNGNGDRNHLFRQRQESDRIEDRDALRGFYLGRRLVNQVAVGALGIVRRIVTIEVADDNCRKYYERDERQRNTEYANCLFHVHSGRSVLKITIS